MMQGEQSKISKDIFRRVVAHNDEGNYDVELLSNGVYPEETFRANAFE